MKTLISSFPFLLLLIFINSSCSKQKDKSTSIPAKQNSEISTADTPASEKISVEKSMEPEIQINYACDQAEIDVTIKGEQAFVKVMRKDQPVLDFTGTHVPSASGAKYAGIHLTYWAKGNECMIIDESTTLLKGCRETQSFQGMFVYMADANMFFPCDESIRLPIAMKGAYLELEKKYLSLVDGGTKIFADVQGYIEKSESMEGNKSKPTLFISKINELSKTNKCS